MNYAEYQEKRYFPVLDSLRAISILLVLSVHLEDNILTGTFRFLSGAYGVPIFFVLSGYLITMLALREEDASGKVNLRAFFVRRIFRIFPLYFFTLLLICIIVFLAGEKETVGRLEVALPYYLTYMNEFSPSAAFFQSWSLGVEEKFYLLWPILAFGLLKRKPSQRLALAVVLIVLFEISHITKTISIMVHYRSILVGCAIAICLNHPGFFSRVCFLGGAAWVYVTTSILLITQLSLESLPFLHFLYPYIVGMALISLLLSGDVTLRWFRHPLLRLIGERSYGIYLVHVLCLRAIEKFLHFRSGLSLSILTLILGTILSLFVSEILYRLLEKPAIDKGKKISAKLAAEKKAVIVPALNC